MAPRIEVTGFVVDPAAVSSGGLATIEAPGAPVVAVGVAVLESEEGPVLTDGLEAVEVSQPLAPDRELAERRGFTGKAGQVMTLLSASPAQPAIVYLGCGKRDELGIDSLRRAAASLVRSSGRSGAAIFVLSGDLAEQAAAAGSPDGDPVERSQAHRAAARALTEGAMLASYRFSSHKSDPASPSLDRFSVAGLGLDASALEEGVAHGRRVAGAVCLARDLVNEPPSSMTPRRLAEAANDLVGRASPGAAASNSEGGSLSLEVWDENRIADERLGGLMAVARGSAEPPRLLRISYEPADPLVVDGRVPHVVLVGKGITFDSGGLSLKSADAMVSMKTDMSGAAAVLAAISTCADLGIRVRVTAIVPATENMPGGRATKPGDVLVARDGQTIEVLNTDAEGRLVLADGLSLAAEMQPDAIVDLATLTGAAVVALGGSIAGLFGNDQALVDRVRAAATRAGEEVWQLPLARAYRSHIESDVADMKNVGKTGQAGSISAALLLERFVADIPWVHLDIAGPARSDEDQGLLTKGGTGFGVRTLLELLDTFGERL